MISTGNNPVLFPVVNNIAYTNSSDALKQQVLSEINFIVFSTVSTECL